MAEFHEAVDYGQRLNEKLKRIKTLETKVKQQARQIERLKRLNDELEKSYREICFENKSLSGKIRRHEREEEGKRTREKELTLIRERARVEEEERQRVRAQYDKRHRDEEDFLQFVDFIKRRRY